MLAKFARQGKMVSVQSDTATAENNVLLAAHGSMVAKWFTVSFVHLVNMGGGPIMGWARPGNLRPF